MLLLLCAVRAVRQPGLLPTRKVPSRVVANLCLKDRHQFSVLVFSSQRTHIHIASLDHHHVDDSTSGRDAGGDSQDVIDQEEQGGCACSRAVCRAGRVQDVRVADVGDAVGMQWRRAGAGGDRGRAGFQVVAHQGVSSVPQGG